MGLAMHAVDDLVGTALGRFRAVQRLSGGGTAEVFLAETISGEPLPWASGPRGRVALKVLRRSQLSSPSATERFEAESEAAARSAHENVLAVGPLERTDTGQPFFAMELLVGLDLADTLAYARALPAARAVRVALGVAAGLSAAHAAGVVHRDVKPENVFLVHAPDGAEVAKVVDFGFAARLDLAPVGPTAVVGTPAYMAPEQALGAAPAPAADVYSLAVVLYEMLAGRPPFEGDYPSLARRHASERPPAIAAVRPEALVSPSLEAALVRGLATRPEERFGSMAAFARALLQTDEGVSARPPRGPR